MTSMIATVAPDCGRLTMDSYWRIEAGSLIEQKLPELVQKPQSLPPYDDSEIRIVSGGFYRPKAWHFAESRMVMGVSGSAHRFVFDEARAAAGVEQFAERWPEWSRLAAEDPRLQTALIIAIGWSNHRRRVVGYTFQPESAWRAELLELGSAAVPDVNRGPGASAFQDYFRHSFRSPLKDHQATELHLLHGRNAAWSSRQGLLGDGGDIVRGPLNMWTVTREGVTVKQLADLDDDRPTNQGALGTPAAEAAPIAGPFTASTTTNHGGLLESLIHSTRRRFTALCGKATPQ